MNVLKLSVLRRLSLVALLSFVSAAQAYGPARRVACVGDSVTFGAGIRNRQANSYPAELGRWLGTDYDVRNFGVNGATLLHQGDRPYIKEKAYAAALEFKPDFLVVNLGANDSKHPGDGSLDAEKAVNNWQYKTNFVADYEALIAAFRQANPAVKVFVCLPTPDYPGRWGINDKTIRVEIIPLVRLVAKETDASLIDLNAPLSEKPEWFPDTVHPNEQGAKAMAKEIYQALRGERAPEMPESAAMLLMNRRVLVLGDSITHDGKYVTFLEYYLSRKFTNQNFDFISIGLSSETTSGLSEKAHPFPRPCVFERLQRALDTIKPTTVIACYGMNDGIYHPQSADRMTAFQDGIRRLSGAVQGAGAQLILLTPPPFDTLPVARHLQLGNAPDFSYERPFTNYDAVLADYSRWELGLPVGDAALVVDLHSTFLESIKAQREKSRKFSFTKDGIHPGATGHLLMAQTILRSVGIDEGWDDLQAELTKIEADPLYPLIRDRREKRSAAWLDYIGYTRDKTVKTPSVDLAEKEAAEAQERIDAARR